jgi:putative tricarboxylic transport membrane protein
MRRLSDILGSLFFALIGIGTAIEAIKLRVGTATEPQPGFFPFLGGVVITILSMVLFSQAWRGKSAGSQMFGDLWRPAFLILGLFFYISVLDFLGYILSTTILCAIVLRIMDTKRWWVLIGVSLILSIGTYGLFDRLLSMPLPCGILEKLW